MKVNIFEKAKNRLRFLFRRPLNFISGFVLRSHYVLQQKDKQYVDVKEIDYPFNEKTTFLDENSPDLAEQFGFNNLNVAEYKFSFNDKRSMKIDCQKSDGENWCVFVFDEFPNQFVFEFDVILKQVIQEFQLAFNYQDLRNRNRFLILENKTVAFDLIKDSYFYPIIHEKKYDTVLKIGDYNHVKFIKNKTEYCLEINSEIIFLVYERKRIIDGNKMALILWEGSKNRRMNCAIKNLKLSYICG